MSSNKSNISILFASIFLVGVGFSIIIPIIPYYAESMGASAFQLGLLLTVYALCQFVFAPYWGAYSDRVGRKPVLLLGILGFAVTFILFGLATSWWMLFFSRIAGGVLACAAIPAAMAYIGDSTSLEKRGASMGLLGASMGMGMIFGPAIGGLLSEISISFPFYFAGCLALLNGAAIYLLLEESSNNIQKTEGVKVKRSSLIEGLITPLAYILVVMLFASIAESTHHGVFALFAKGKLGLGPSQVGWAFSSAGAVAVIVQGLLVGKMINHYGEERTAITGVILMIVGFSLLLNSFNLVSIVLFMGVFASGIGLLRPALTSAVSKRTTMEQGKAMGILQGYDSLGRVIGPAGGGLLLDINIDFAYIAAIIASVIALILLFIHNVKTSNTFKNCNDKIA